MTYISIIYTDVKFLKNVELHPDKTDLDTFMVKFKNYLVLNKIE